MKIPAEAKKVFQGEIFDVYQWQQKMYDGTYQTFEALRRPLTIQILPTMGDKILLSYEEQPIKPKAYTFLGGRGEKGEEPLTTAKRELLEESGLISDDWELYKMYESETKIDWQIYLYIARNCRKVQEQDLDSGEKLEVKKVSFNEFLAHICSEDFWGTMIAADIMRKMLTPGKLEEFRKKLFPQ
ncbi:MAG: NUDIX hydrolase [bacterium]|nr:NUDIX hydrolase [bacterium]